MVNVINQLEVLPACLRIMMFITSHLFLLFSGKTNSLPVAEDGRDTHLLITEQEVLFGFPAHYTDGPNLSISDRRKLLGKAWCVPVVEDLLRPLATLFLTTLGCTAQSPEPV